MKAEELWIQAENSSFGPDKAEQLAAGSGGWNVQSVRLSEYSVNKGMCFNSLNCTAGMDQDWTNEINCMYELQFFDGQVEAWWVDVQDEGWVIN